MGRGHLLWVPCAEDRHHRAINHSFASGKEALTHLGLKVARLIRSKPSKGVKRSAKARYVKLHSQSCRLSDSPRLALVFEPNVSLGHVTDLVQVLSVTAVSVLYGQFYKSLNSIEN